MIRNMYPFTNIRICITIESEKKLGKQEQKIV